MFSDSLTHLPGPNVLLAVLEPMARTCCEIETIKTGKLHLTVKSARKYRDAITTLQPFIDPAEALRISLQISEAIERWNALQKRISKESTWPHDQPTLADSIESAIREAPAGCKTLVYERILVAGEPEAPLNRQVERDRAESMAELEAAGFRFTSHDTVWDENGNATKEEWHYELKLTLIRGGE